MKRIPLAFICCISIFYSLASSTHYGLSFYPSTETNKQSRILFLNNRKPFSLNKELIIGMKVEYPDKLTGGNILSIHTNDGQTIHLAFAQSAGNPLPNLQLNTNGTIHPFPYPLNEVRDVHTLSVKLDKEKEEISVSYDQNTMFLPASLSKVSEVTIQLGATDEEETENIASVNIRDIHILQDSYTRFFWELKQHEGHISYDAIQKAPAVALNPYWILDSHRIWRTIYTKKSDENTQVAFNPKDNVFYFVTDSAVTGFYPATGAQRRIDIRQGFRASIYSNTLEYDTIGNRLVSYSLEDKAVSFFDFRTHQWSHLEKNIKETFYSNHSWAQTDSLGYAFGGYGFYSFFNTLFQIDLKNGTVCERPYTPEIIQRTYASSAIVGDELYIFGGKGQAVKKEGNTNSHYYYDMYAINLKTMKARKVWEKESPRHHFICAPTMYYIPNDSAFYVAGELQILKVSINNPHWTELSAPAAPPAGPYKDMVYNFYYAPKFQCMYLLVNKRIDTAAHDMTIYTINLPLAETLSTPQEKPHATDKHLLYFITLTVLFLLSFIFLLYWKKNRKSNRPNKNLSSTQLTTIVNSPPHKSAIYLLGNFKIINKKGVDITSSFTSRLQALLSIFIVYHTTDEQQIQIEKVDEYLWPGKETTAARNNRNVYMRKLRILLKDIGDIEIKNNKGFYRIQLNPDIYIDYYEILQSIKAIRKDETPNPQRIARTLQLIQKGPFLPAIQEEWLDKFKGEYTDTVVNLLEELLRQSILSSHDKMTIQIADTLLMCDWLNEEALQAKCYTLCKIGKSGLSKIAYDNFCKEYKKTMGEAYKKTLTACCTFNQPPK